ncbi:MAG: hypothetical protein WCG06_05640, partial [Candidatus Omnitrophota bacterium]
RLCVCQGTDEASMALRFVADGWPGSTAILGADNGVQIKANVTALEAPALGRPLLQQLRRLSIRDRRMTDPRQWDFFK